MLAWPAMRMPGVAVSVATAMLLGAVFAGDSVWTAIAVLAVAGGWGAAPLAGPAPPPRGGLGRARSRRPCAASRWRRRASRPRPCDCRLERPLGRLVGGARSLVGRA